MRSNPIMNDGVEFAFALTQRIEQDGRAGGNALGRGAGSFLGQTTGLHSAAHQMFVRGLGGGILDAGTAHEMNALASKDKAFFTGSG
jgi:hypothetical protein